MPVDNFRVFRLQKKGKTVMILLIFRRHCQIKLLPGWKEIDPMNSRYTIFIGNGMNESLYTRRYLDFQTQNLIYFYFQGKKSGIDIYRTRLKSNMRDICNFDIFFIRFRLENRIAEGMSISCMEITWKIYAFLLITDFLTFMIC